MTSKLCCLQDPFISTGEPAGTYPPYERGNQLQVWITQSDGVTPALGKVSVEVKVAAEVGDQTCRG